jgi:hypothetical protein
MSTSDDGRRKIVVIDRVSPELAKVRALIEVRFTAKGLSKVVDAMAAAGVTVEVAPPARVHRFRKTD